MGPSKSMSGKGSVSGARVGKTHKPMGSMAGKGSGNTKRDSAVATGTPVGGKTLRYTSGDVKRSTGSFKSYK